MIELETIFMNTTQEQCTGPEGYGKILGHEARLKRLKNVRMCYRTIIL